MASIWPNQESSYQPNNDQSFSFVNSLSNEQPLEQSSQGIKTQNHTPSNLLFRYYQNQNTTDQSLPDSLENAANIGQYTPCTTQLQIQTSVITSPNNGLHNGYFFSSGQGNGNNFNTINSHTFTQNSKSSFSTSAKNIEIQPVNTFQDNIHKVELIANNENSNTSKTIKNDIKLMYRPRFKYDLFIKHVKRNECIWNRYHEEYNNKESRKRAWLDVLRRIDEEDPLSNDYYFRKYHEHGEYHRYQMIKYNLPFKNN